MAALVIKISQPSNTFDISKYSFEGGVAMSTRASEYVEEPIDPERFKAFIRSILRLPAHAIEQEIRDALRLRNDGMQDWYESRLKAIEQFHGN